MLLFAFPVSAATPQETLERKANDLLKIIYTDMEDEAIQAQDDVDEETGEFFAVPEDLVPVPGDEEEGEYVTFQENNSTVTLFDVPRKSWFGPYVRDAVERGIVSGYRYPNGAPTGEYGPGNNVSIAELAKMAVLAAHINNDQCGEPKNAAAQHDWSKAFIACAEQRKWSVYADGSVSITRPATRAEVVVTLLEAFGITYQDRTVPTRFSDVNAQTPYATAIGKAVADGIVSGYADAGGAPSGTFGPGNPINRAEIAKVLSGTVQVYGG